MNKDEFDRLFDAAFEDAAKNHLPAPDPEPSWAKVEAMLKKRSKKRFRPVPYAVAASFLVGAFIIGSPSATKAFSPFIQTIKRRFAALPVAKKIESHLQLRRGVACSYM